MLCAWKRTCAVLAATDHDDVALTTCCWHFSPSMLLSLPWAVFTHAAGGPSQNGQLTFSTSLGCATVMPWQPTQQPCQNLEITIHVAVLQAAS